ncbi:MAG TPA: hypothetical protein VHX15_08420 [Frankiaceae bacterium]|jgi:hypothetical protein|nr:hypothetical protein [Frankiaceae bacterium]
MNDPETLQAKAARVLGGGETILAAGIFGLQTNYAAVTVGGVVGSSLLGGGVAGGALGNAAGMHAGRELDAESKGVTVRMLVAVTATHIHVLDWVTGSGPTRELRSFDRSTTCVEVKKFGLSRRLHLQDKASGEALALTGSASALSAEAKGDKGVFKALAA